MEKLNHKNLNTRKSLKPTRDSIQKENKFIDFYQWLKDNTDLKETSISHYCSALKIIEREFNVEIGLIKTPEELNNILNILNNNFNYTEKNSRGNHMYSAALIQYEKYIISKNNIKKDVQDFKSSIKEKYDKQDFLKEVFISEKSYGEIINIIERKKNIILQGAPGVGKTFIAKRLAYSIMGEKDYDRVKCIQFHQSYSYEDFIEGYRPHKNSFELEQGVFYDFCKIAEADKENRPYFFIIDEINRGNLSKIFGELLMLLEGDKRAEKLNLVYSKTSFSVPSNIYVIGMMNTADRSLAIMDYALRRRFAFYCVEPGFESKQFKEYQKNLNNPKFNELIELIKQLNEEIAKDPSLGDGYKIGHSYFCNFKSITKEDLECIVKYEILPLIEEYWIDDIDKYNIWNENLNGVLNNG